MTIAVSRADVSGLVKYDLRRFFFFFFFFATDSPSDRVQFSSYATDVSVHTRGYFNERGSISEWGMEGRGFDRSMTLL